MHGDERRGFPATREDINRTSVEVLLVDAGLALTFISIAERDDNRETVERNIRNARKAYESIQQFRPRHVFTDAQADALDSQLAEARTRLEALGQVF